MKSKQRALNRAEAASFVDDVKSRFEHDPEKYDRFLDIMMDLKEDLYVTSSWGAFSHAVYTGSIQLKYSSKSLHYSMVIQT